MTIQSDNISLICAPITEIYTCDFLAAIDQAQQTADAIELRLDYLMDDERARMFAELPARLPGITKPLIFTFRPREQGGQRDLSLADRQAFWRSLPPSLISVMAYADFELDLVESFIGSSPIPWEKVICSYHNFDETPGNVA